LLSPGEHLEVEKHKGDESENKNSRFEWRDQGNIKVDDRSLGARICLQGPSFWHFSDVLALILRQIFIFKLACLTESANTGKDG
jgi:hypothetical protein